jgi:hypothetical protein
MATRRLPNLQSAYLAAAGLCLASGSTLEPEVVQPMSVNPELRSLDIDIPAQPQALVQLSLLLADDDINLQAAASLIESDMALAAAVMKAVNSSLYGLKGRVQSVQQAITYLGMREVAAITFELGCALHFPPAPGTGTAVAARRLRGLLMGRLANKLALDAWAAHSAGCSRSVARRCCSAMRRTTTAPCCAQPPATPNCHAGTHRLWRQPRRTGRGLCESWGLGPAAVASVRHHVARWPRATCPNCRLRGDRSVPVGAGQHAGSQPGRAGRGGADRGPAGGPGPHAGIARAAPAARATCRRAGQRPRSLDSSGLWA